MMDIKPQENARSSEQQQARWRYLLFITFMSILAMLGYFSSDMYLPAFPQMTVALATSSSLVGLTFSLFMLGLAIGQLFYGPLSDQIGRKKTLLLGLLLYLTASIGCFFSNNIIQLLLFRLLQALGACAATVLWQAIVMDKYEHLQVRRIFAIVFPLLGVSPALAPVVGGIVTTFAGWRMVFAVLIVIAILLVLASFILKESLSGQATSNKHFCWQTLGDNYKRLFLSKHYMSYLLVVCIGTSNYFCYLVISPFVFKTIGYSAQLIGYSYIPQTIAFMLGGFSSEFFATRYGNVLMMRKAILLAALSAFVMLGLTVFLPMVSGLQIIIPFLFAAFANGILYPLAMAQAYQPFQDIAGTAAGLAGFLQALTIFIFTSFAAAIVSFGAVGLAILMTALSVFTIILFKFWVMSRG